MLQVSIVFFITGLIALSLGLQHAAGLSFDAGRILFFGFLALSCLAFLASLWPSRRNLPQPRSR